MKNTCKLIRAKDGNMIPVISEGGKSYRFGSLYDGRYAAERWVVYHIPEGVEHVILFGIGDCQVALEVLNRVPGYVVVYEPNRELFHEIRHTAVFKKLQSIRRFQIYGGTEALSKTKEAMWEIINENAIDTTVVRCQWGYADRYSSEVLELQDAYKNGCEAIMTLKPSVKRFATAMIRNQIANIKQMEGGIPLGRLRKYWDRDMPVIVVSAGPSLEKNIDVLKEVKKRAFIFAVDAALPLLLKNDIIPDLVACADASKNANCFADPKSHEISMLVSANTPAWLIQENQGKKIWGFSAGFLNELQRKCGLEVPIIPVSLGVATMILATLVDLGTKKIVLVGQDLAYSPDGKSHISGRDEGFVKDEAYKTEGYDGGMVWSRRDWTLTREWMEKIIRVAKGMNNREFINATEGGAKIQGTVQKTLREVVSELNEPTTTWEEIVQNELFCIRADEYQVLMREFEQGKRDLEQMREIGYHGTFFEENYREIPVMSLIFDYMRSLDDKQRRTRFEKAVDYVYNEYCKEMA